MATHVGKFLRAMPFWISLGDDYYGDARTVDSHITRLRSKLPDKKLRQWDIVTIRGIGYKLERNSAR